MRCIPAFLLILALLPLATGQASNAPEIAEIHPDPDGGREFIELLNPTGSSLDLGGWRLEDAVGNGYTFTDHAVGPGGRIVLWSGGAADALGPATSSATIWNNGGDTVRLLDPTGTLVQSITYGTPGLPAPAKGMSLHYTEADWFEAAPSPGGAPGAQVGTATATVEDVPPTVAFQEVPERLRPSEAGQVTFSIHDPNGDDDVVAWSLQDGATLLAEGETAGNHQAVIQFQRSGEVVLTLRAEDQAGHTHGSTASLTVGADALVVTLPAEGLTFPTLPPGGGPVDATLPFLLRNEGTADVAPLIDISDLQGPGTVPVAGHMQVGTRIDSAGDWTWTPYDAPLTGLPSLAAGNEVQVLLRLTEVPTPLAAGTYHTSFTVVE